MGISLSDTGSLIAPTSKTGQTESPSAALDDKRVKLVKNRTECELRVGPSRFKAKERWKIDKNASTVLDRDGHTQPRSDDYNFSKKDHGYQYHKLDLVKQEIRLLVLDSAQDGKSGISCSLEHVPLFKSGPYIALSYRWGNETNSINISIESSTVPVTKNLYHALRAILKVRHEAVNGVAKPLRVWVDAICINQNGDQEKSKQLLYMRQIYAQAKEVVAWVGPTEKRRLSSRTAKSLQDLLIRERGGHLTDKQLEAAGLFFQ